MKTFNFKKAVDQYYETNHRIPSIQQLVDIINCDPEIIREQCQLAPQAIFTIRDKLLDLLNRSYKIYYTMVPAMASDTYPFYRGIALHLNGTDGEHIKIIIAPIKGKLSIQMDIVDLSAINQYLKKSCKKYLKKHCLKENSYSEIRAGFSTDISFNKTQSIFPYYKMQIRFYEFSDDICNVVVDFLLKAKGLYNYVRVLNEKTESNRVIKKNLDYIAATLFAGRSTTIAIAENILKAFQEESMNLQSVYLEGIYLQFLSKPVEVTLHDEGQSCHISADLGTIDERDRNKLIQGQLQFWLGLESGGNGFLYVDDEKHLCYRLELEYMKIPFEEISKISKIIIKKIKFASKLKERYRQYIDEVYEN